jgi:signal transduction histidine kinase
MNTANDLGRQLESCRAQLALLHKQFSKAVAQKKQIEQQYKQTCDQVTESRNNLMTIFDGFPEPLFLLDNEAKIQMLNKAAALYCRTDYKMAIGQYCAEICPHGERFCAEYSIAEMIREGRQITVERKIDTPSERREKITMLPLASVRHGNREAIFRIQDITEREKINEQMVLADRLASLSQLSSGISHEIRNPLASIMLFVDILADPKRFRRSSQETEILDEIKENVQKITDIIARVFDFARLNSSHRLPSDINKLLQDMLRLWIPKMKQSAITAEFRPQPDLPRITGDSVELQQAFSNLILNAIEAMPEGGTLSLTTATALSAFHAQRKVIVITCRDTGIGIPDDLRKSIFNPFFSTKAESSGLGLTISYQIIKRHGGVLYCSASDEGKTVFSIELPVDHRHDDGEVM